MRPKKAFGNGQYRFVLVLLAVVMLTPNAKAEDAKQGPAKIELDVLYAGNPGSQRTEDFEALLKRFFRGVEIANFETFKAEDAEPFDVVIFDWTSIFPRNEQGKITWQDGLNLSQPRPPQLDRNFSKPVVMIGAAAGSLSDQLRTAINWKCLCLENMAHDVDATHPIFKGPIAVELEFEQKEKPLDYYLAPGTDALGETLPVWKIQEKSFPDVDPGLVSSRENFVHTPDAEVISGGFNGKGPTSVAIGRHGNFLLWGFSGQPSDMTASARRVFVNAVCYIDQFDGKTPGPVVTTYGGRDNFVESIYFLRSITDEYIDRQVDHFNRGIQETPLRESQRQQIGNDPAAYFRKRCEPHAKRIRQKIPLEVRKNCDDVEQLVSYYRDNVEYLRTDGKGGFVVDEDARQLGISNRDIALLDKCVGLLKSNEKTDLAQRVLERYTRQQMDTATDWRRWLDAHRDALRFDEPTGKFVE